MLGVVSLILWALFVIVTLKYVVILLRADNNGEGGTLTLMALASRAVGRTGRAATVVALFGIVSAALFYGDAVITPALSVLSAVEGLDVATPAFHEYVVPLTVVILIVLFAVQSFGTAKVAALFGPIMVVWFVAIALPGLAWIGRDPGILWALNPFYGVSFLTDHGMIGLFTLGAVFLAVTGAEALYADLGHFGRGPIQVAWLALVLPSLALNYLGQGALVFAHPKALENPFFLLYPEWARISMVVLATIATVIASQAVITGAYSLTSQAIQLGLLPRFEVRHTSAHTVGQIFMPRVNSLLLGRRAAAGGAVPLVERAGVGLRHRRHRHHGRHLHDGVHRDLADVALVAARGRGLDRAVLVDRSHLPLAPTCSRWFRAAGCRWRSAGW